MKALINQLKSMSDEALESIYKNTSDKCVRLMVQVEISNVSFSLIEKVESLKLKYSFVEAELKARNSETVPVIAALDTITLKEVEVEKAQAIVDKLSLNLVVK